MARVRTVLAVAFAAVLASYGSALDHPQGTSLSMLPAAAQQSISTALGQDIPSYYATAASSGFQAVNVTQQLTSRFGLDGVQIDKANASLGIVLERYGYGDRLAAVPSVMPRANLNRVEYQRGAVTEWYVNGPVGLEQGFTISQRPGKSDGQPLELVFQLSGNLQASVDKDQRSMTLANREGSVWKYAGLSARDAKGRELRAWMELRGNQLMLEADDQGARYPVTIDPTIQLAELTAASGVDGSLMGASIAFSGSVVVVGAPQAPVGTNSEQGAAYVFVKPTGGWANMTQTAELTASSGAAGDLFGYSVSISGNTIVVGAPNATVGTHASQGAAYVFVQPTNGWINATQNATLTSSDGAANDNFGSAVSIDTSTVAVGALGAHYTGFTPGPGEAYVYVEPGSGWVNMTETAQLTALGGKPSDELGVSVSISGNTVVAGAPMFGFYDPGRGTAYVFVEPVGGWTKMTQTAKLTASDSALDAGFGYSTSISGSTIAVGAPLVNLGTKVGAGEAYVFVQPTGGWKNSTETGKLTASDGAGGNKLGYSVFASGNTIAVGAPGANSSAGTLYLYLKPSAGWKTGTQSSELKASDGVAGNRLGYAVSAGGSTAVVGSPGTANTNTTPGEAYVFGP